MSDRRSRLRAAAARPAPLAILLGLLGTAVSVTGSWIPSLWGDEAASLLSAQRSFPELLKLVQHVDAVHAIYYLGLNEWIDVFGASPFSIRFPSALAVGVAVAGVVVVAHRIGGAGLALSAGLVAAVLPRMTYVGEEARSYAFTAAFAVWLTVLLLGLIRPGGIRPRTRRLLWIGYALLLCLGTLVFAYFALVGVGHGVALACSRAGRRVLRRGVFAVAAAAVGATPILIVGYLERDQIAYLEDRDELTVQRVGIDMWFGQWWFAVVGWLLLALGVWAAWRSQRTAAPEVDPGWLVAGWTLVPTALLIGTSPVVAGFTPRYLAMSAPGVALLMALGLRMLVRAAADARARRAAGAAGAPTRRIGVATAVATALVVVLAAPVWALQRTPYAKNDSDWSQLSATVHRLASAGDAIVFDESARPSVRPRLGYRTYPAGFAGLRDVTLDVSYLRNHTWYDSSYTVAQAAVRGRFDGVDRVWLVEYMDPLTGHVDRYGVAELERLGFHRISETKLHSDAVLGFVRD